MENKTNFLKALNKLYCLLDKDTVISDINNEHIHQVNDNSGRLILWYDDGERAEGVYIDNFELVSDVRILAKYGHEGYTQALIDSLDKIKERFFDIKKTLTDLDEAWEELGKMEELIDEELPF